MLQAPRANPPRVERVSFASETTFKHICVTLMPTPTVFCAFVQQLSFTDSVVDLHKLCLDDCKPSLDLYESCTGSNSVSNDLHGFARICTNVHGITATYARLHGFCTDLDEVARICTNADISTNLLRLHELARICTVLHSFAQIRLKFVRFVQAL